MLELSPNNAAYVDLLYHDVLPGDAEAGGKATQVAFLEAGAIRDKVASNFLSLDEAVPYHDAQIFAGDVALPPDLHPI